MKILKNGLLLSAFASILASGGAFAGEADFTMVNRTGYTLREVYISPSHKNRWGNDRLGRSFLDHGRSRLFTFSDKSACEQDIQVVFDDDGSKVTWEEVDLCEINKITLKYNRKSGVVSADTE